MKDIAIIGTGAVGGLYGALLQQQGHRVHFLLHNDFEHVRKHGLLVESPLGDMHLPKVNAYNDPAKMPPCDLVVVALKTTANHALKSILPPIAKEHTLILTLQNGLGSEEQIAEVVGSSQIIGGLCFLCSSKVGPGHILHQDYGLITLGEYRTDGLPAGTTPRLKEVGQRLESAGIPIQLVEDLLLARWKKLVWNIPFNGLSVVRNKLTDELINDAETRMLCRTLMNEVATASAACARPIENEFIEKMISNTQKMKPYSPSMKLDYDRGNPMEIEAIYGAPLRIAYAKGVAMPETEKLYRALQRLQKDRA